MPFDEDFDAWERGMQPAGGAVGFDAEFDALMAQGPAVAAPGGRPLDLPVYTDVPPAPGFGRLVGEFLKDPAEYAASPFRPAPQEGVLGNVYNFGEAALAGFGTPEAIPVAGGAFALAGIMDTYQAQKLLLRAQKGEQVDPVQLGAARHTLAQAQARAGAQAERYESVGGVAGTVVPSAVTIGSEFAVTGGVASLARAAGKRAATKALGALAKRGVGRFAIGALGYGAAGAARTLGMPPRLWAEYARRRLHPTTTDKAGKVRVSPEQAGKLAAAGHAFMSLLIENTSEELGGEVVGAVLKRVPVLGRVAKKARGYITKLVGPGAGKIFQKTGFHGVVAEMTEERMAALGHWAMEDRSVSGALAAIWPGWTQIAGEAVGFAVPIGGAMAAQAAAEAGERAAPAEEAVAPAEAPAPVTEAPVPGGFDAEFDALVAATAPEAEMPAEQLGPQPLTPEAAAELMPRRRQRQAPVEAAPVPVTPSGAEVLTPAEAEALTGEQTYAMTEDEARRFHRARGQAAIDIEGRVVETPRELAAPAAEALMPAPAEAAPEAVAKQPWEMTRDELEVQYRPAGDVVDGRKVRGDVPNTESIDASVPNATVLRGIYEMPLSEFDLTGKHYSVEGNKRIAALAKEISQSNELNPLIVVIDAEGPYILEGATRADALYRLGAKSFPALIVLDEGAFYDAAQQALAEGKPVPPEVLADYPDLQAAAPEVEDQTPAQSLGDALEVQSREEREDAEGQVRAAEERPGDVPVQDAYSETALQERFLAEKGMDRAAAEALPEPKQRSLNTSYRNWKKRELMRRDLAELYLLTENEVERGLKRFAAEIRKVETTSDLGVLTQGVADAIHPGAVNAANVRVLRGEVGGEEPGITRIAPGEVGTEGPHAPSREGEIVAAIQARAARAGAVTGVTPGELAGETMTDAERRRAQRAPLPERIAGIEKQLAAAEKGTAGYAELQGELDRLKALGEELRHAGISPSSVKGAFKGTLKWLNSAVTWGVKARNLRKNFVDVYEGLRTLGSGAEIIHEQAMQFITDNMGHLPIEQRGFLLFHQEMQKDPKYAIPKGDKALQTAADWQRKVYAFIQQGFQKRGFFKTPWPQSQIARNVDRIEQLHIEIDDLVRESAKDKRRLEIAGLTERNEQLEKLSYVRHTVYMESQVDKWTREGNLKEALDPIPKRLFGRKLTLEDWVEIEKQGGEQRGQLEKDAAVALYDVLTYSLRKFAVNDFHEGLKKSQPDLVQTKDTAPQDWQPVPGISAYRGYLVHPFLKEALDDFTRRIGKRTPIGVVYDAFNSIFKQIKFFNPFIMTLYNTMQSFGAVGVRGIARAIPFPKSFPGSAVLGEAWREVMGKGPFYRALQKLNTFPRPADLPLADRREQLLHGLDMAASTQSAPIKWLRELTHLERGIDFTKPRWWLDVLLPTNMNLFLQLNRKSTWWMDRLLRTGTAMAKYKELVKRGMHPTEAIGNAARTARKFHADYDIMNAGASKWARRIFLTPAYQVAMWANLFPDIALGIVGGRAWTGKHGLARRQAVEVGVRLAVGFAGVTAIMARYGYAWTEAYRFIKKEAPDPDEPEDEGVEQVVLWPGPWAEIPKMVGRVMQGWRGAGGGPGKKVLAAAFRAFYNKLAPFPHIAASFWRGRNWKGDVVFDPRRKYADGTTIPYGWQITKFIAQELYPIYEQVEAWGDKEQGLFNNALRVVAISRFTRQPQRQWYLKKVKNKMGELRSLAAGHSKDRPDMATYYHRQAAQQFVEFEEALSQRLRHHEDLLANMKTPSQVERFMVSVGFTKPHMVSDPTLSRVDQRARLWELLAPPPLPPTRPQKWETPERFADRQQKYPDALATWRGRQAFLQEYFERHGIKGEEMQRLFDEHVRAKRGVPGLAGRLSRLRRLIDRQ